MERQTSDQQPVTLDDLKRAIESFSRLKDEASFKGQDGGFLHALDTVEALAIAWRTAFEWRETFLRKAVSSLGSEEALARWHAERDEGMALIREALR